MLNIFVKKGRIFLFFAHYKLSDILTPKKVKEFIKKMLTN